MNIETKLKIKKKTGDAEMQISIPFEEFEAYRNKAIGIHASGGEVQGFRKGKAPRPRVIAHFGKSKMDEFAYRLMACEAIEEALKSEKTAPDGKVHIDLPEFAEGKEFKFNATFKVGGDEGSDIELELPWPVIGQSWAGDEDRPYGKTPDYLRRR